MNITVLSTGIVAVVPAAGIGSRMQSTCPKQYLKIGDQTLLEYSIASLLLHPQITHVVIALHPQDAIFSTLPLASDPRIHCVVGGETRAESVLAGLQVINQHGDPWVLVHDAARPCLHPDDLHRLVASRGTAPWGAILATPVKDTIKRAKATATQIAHTVDRQDLWHALTPQFFPLTLLQACLEKGLQQGATLTDEASAVEYCGFYPKLIDSRSDNIKVTRPEDLALAEFYISRLD